MTTDWSQRKFLRFEDWPELDRLAWNALFEVGDVFGDAGRARHWRPATRRSNRQHYARWLGHLALTGELELERAPDARGHAGARPGLCCAPHGDACTLHRGILSGRPQGRDKGNGPGD